jgi:hypothetical protein
MRSNAYSKSELLSLLPGESPGERLSRLVDAAGDLVSFQDTMDTVHRRDHGHSLGPESNSDTIARDVLSFLEQLRDEHIL